MSKIYNYDDFLNEEFFKKLFKKNNKSKTISKVESTAMEIIKFLNDNEIYDWNDFISARNVDRKIIDTIIDNSVTTMSELKEIRFKVKLELSDNTQLREWLKELELEEEYEKCAQIIKKINNR
jgi:hypothetical protein